MDRRSSVIAAVVSAACFGTLAVFTSLAYSHNAQPMPLLAWRFSLAAVLLGGYLGLARPHVLKVPLADVGRYAILAVGGYGAASICFFFALKFTSASIVAILLYTYPAMVALGERVFSGVALTGWRWAAICLTFAGSALVADPFSADAGVGAAGIALGLGAALCYSAFSMLSHRWGEGRPRTALMAYMFAFTALLATSVALLTGASLSPVTWDVQVWPLLLAIVVFPTFIAIVLYLRAVRGLGPSQAAILSTFEPVFTIALAALFLGETLSLIQWAGAALVLVGVVVAERTGRPAEDLALV